LLAPAAAGLAILAVAAAILVLRPGDHAAVVGRPSAAVTTPTVTATATPTPPLDEVVAELTTRARGAASANDDPDATAAAVKTTFRKAEIATDSGESGAAAANAPVWLIQILGDFTCYECKTVAPEPPITGTVIFLIIDARTWEGYTFGLTRTPIDLSRLGAVIPLT
jgi:hypothetical protein